MTTPDFETYLEEVRRASSTAQDWRAGQTYFNVLWSVHPNLAEDIRGTTLDPFHFDDRISQFLVYVHNSWNDAPI